MKNKYQWFIQLYLVCAIFLTSAIAAEKTLYNPHPLPDDLVLPMPNGAEIVFRPVIVPGSNFWGDRQRIIELGTNIEDIFSSKQKSLVSGSFPSSNGQDWLIWIAKYELTQGQYVAVMGEQALLENSGYEKNKKPGQTPYAKLSGKNLKYEQTKPLAWISYPAVNEFIKNYNRWLFDPKHPERLKNIPKIDSVPGFIRLPTEEEWEFSARGGMESIVDGRFPSDFPFPDTQLKKYAYVTEKEIKSINNKKLANPLGIHGLYGNVQEMVGGVFRPEMVQGKPGGVIIRGGAYDSGTIGATPALRTEMDLYRWDTDSKRMIEEGNYKIGTRLAIGSNVLPHKNYKNAVLVKDLKAYLQNVKPITPVGERNQNLVGQVTTQLGNINDHLQRIIQRYPDAIVEVKAAQQDLDKAAVKLEHAQHREARSIAQDATRNATNILTLMHRANFAQKFLDNAVDEDVKKEYRNFLVKNKEATDQQFRGYINKIEELGSYKPKYQQSAMEKLKQTEMPKQEIRALEMVDQHIAYFNRENKVSKENWWKEFQQMYMQHKEEFIIGE